MPETLNNIAYYADSPAEAEREIQRRDDLIAIVEELEKFTEAKGLTPDLLEKVVPVPSSSAVIDHLRGEFDIEFSYKVVATLVWADLQAIDEFWQAWVKVVELEYRMFRQHLMKEIE